nr:PREDICTED: alpha-2-macroglobulin [Latimeria chalumnae]|eukprot:XP_014351915.1 PREDICTED: alpha-2-macroglobulin [Latimeria chalumnae]
MWSGILWGCLLLHVCTGSSPEPNYLVVIPSVIHSGTTEKVCVHLAYLNETITITLTLNHGTESTTLLEKEVQDPHWHQCISFQVPGVTWKKVGLLEVHGKGQTYQFQKSNKVLIQKLESSTFVQTDKPIYKPGQTVKFWIVSLDENFMTVHKKYPLVQLQDPKKNRIAQWLNVKAQQGIAALQFVLNFEPPLGTYAITVEKYNESKVTHTFTVEEYVLPKFEVQIKLPPVITTLDKEFIVALCGKYTYGKPVQGEAHFTVCKKIFRFWRKRLPMEQCLHFTGKTDKNGCFSQVINTAKYTLTRMGYKEFNLEGNITEEGTGVSFTKSGSVELTSKIVTISFEDTDDYYKLRLPYSGTIKLKGADKTPIPNEKIYLLVIRITEEGRIKNWYNYTTDGVGQAYFELNTRLWAGDTVSLEAKMKSHDLNSDSEVITWHRSAIMKIQPFYSKSNSFLKVHRIRGELSCDTEQTIQADYIYGKVFENKADHIDFCYLVMSKGGIVLEGHKEISTGNSRILKGSFSISIPIGPDVAPIVRMLIYTILPSGEVLADAVLFKVSNCFRNKVKLEFSPPKDLPGADVNLHLQASPGSLCAIRAVDQSVLLLKPEEELSSHRIYNLLPVKDLTGYDSQLKGSEYYPCDSGQSNYFDQEDHDKMDVYNTFKHTGLKILTDAPVKEPVHCESRIILRSGQPIFRTKNPMTVLKNALISITDDPVEPTKENLRTYFPETWIWQFIPVGSSGEKQVHMTIPDTITEWKAGMFCTGDVGFGLSPTVSLNAFKPFFLELTLPYSVVRGEAFTLKATVFNYLSQCIMIQATLQKSEDFLSEPCDNCDYTRCLCANEGKTFYWNVTPRTLGEVNFTLSAKALHSEVTCGNEAVVVPKKGATDTIIKSLLVEPEGTEKETTHSSLICPADIPITEEISVQVPENVVEGSTRAHISVLGDIMGSALQNLDRLLAMPFGCGEQNMILFAPNIYIMQYLEKTGQLTDTIKAKAVNFLESGYQRELNYKHDDGSYSAFGSHDKEGNTWLTAFVLKSFSQAQPFIFIDEKHLTQAVNWLSLQQKNDGCFRSVGKLFHTELKGGVDNEVSLSAYITAAVLELNDPSLGQMVRKSLSCLEDSVETVTNVYTLALMAYAFTLAGTETTREILLKKLDNLAIKKDGTMHWERANKPKHEDTPFFWYRAPSAEVEMTAYVLLALISRSQVTSSDIDFASMIVKWLTKQQNPYGGFSSTQDTVVALHALSKYAGHTYSRDGENSVTVKSDKGFWTVFHVDNTNSLLLQQAALPHIPATYSTEVKGKRCVFLQTTLRYNIPPPKNEPTFEISVKTTPEECTELAKKTFQLNLTVRYTGKRQASNMAIIDVKMLSGFIPVKKSVKMLEQALSVKKTEIQTTHVIIYLDEVRVHLYSTHEGTSPIDNIKRENSDCNIDPDSLEVITPNTTKLLMMASGYRSITV